jgi:hypothetical protein
MVIHDPSSKHRRSGGSRYGFLRASVAGSLNEAILRLIPEFVQRQTARGATLGNKVT